jgi:hypothetical protein
MQMSREAVSRFGVDTLTSLKIYAFLCYMVINYAIDNYFGVSVQYVHSVWICFSYDKLLYVEVVHEHAINEYWGSAGIIV